MDSTFDRAMYRIDRMAMELDVVRTQVHVELEAALETSDLAESRRRIRRALALLEELG